MNETVAYGKRIKKFLRTDAGYEILDSSKLTQGTLWDAGGCWTVARALHRVLPDSELVSVLSANGTEHVAVWWNGYFLDGNGTQTQKQLLARVGENAGGAADLYLGPHDPTEVRKRGIVCPVGVVQKLEAAFRSLL